MNIPKNQSGDNEELDKATPLPFTQEQIKFLNEMLKNKDSTKVDANTNDFTRMVHPMVYNSDYILITMDMDGTERKYTENIEFILARSKMIKIFYKDRGQELIYTKYLKSYSILKGETIK